MQIQYLERIKQSRVLRWKLIFVFLIMSVFVVFAVFWRLRIVGITMAGEAMCGCEEHIHTEECISRTLICELEESETHTHNDDCYQSVYICGKEEHIHTDSCYSDFSADVETSDIWEATLSGITFTENGAENLISVAYSQLGYTESQRNFETDTDGIRHGYTRYGEWYGNPYGEWSAMFVSFCLNYAGLDEISVNSGAEAMRIQWQNENIYQSAEAYTPLSGDIVFFDNNLDGVSDSVGIVTGIDNDMMNVISGDYEDTVQEFSVSLDDDTILGYGAININKIDSTKMMLLLKSSSMDIKEYIESQENGTFTLTLLNTDNTEIPKNQSGEYIVTAETEYKLAIGMNAPNGISAGTYTYQLPEGLVFKADEGNFVIDGENIGTWTVDSSGNMTFSFYEIFNQYTDTTISISMEMHFTETSIPVEFDGNITVIVNSPESEEDGTKVSKWARDRSNIENADSDKIYWGAEIIGGKDSDIVGSVISDRIDGNITHHYTQSDMDSGIEFMAFEYDENGEEIDGHKWIVYPQDSDLTWTETGWSYRIPESFYCEWCYENASAGNDNWLYYIKYTSTKCDDVETGYAIYRNKFTADGSEADGWYRERKGQNTAGIIKTVDFDETDKKYHWDIDVTIPARNEDEKGDYYWHLWDDMKIKLTDDTSVSVLNNLDKAEVTAEYGGKVINVPSCENATADAPFYWKCTWSSEEDGVFCGREITFYWRCNCNEETCPLWEDGECACREKNGFCRCYTGTEDIEFHISYTTDNALELIEQYGGENVYIRNYCELDNQQKNNGEWSNSLIDCTTAKMDMPNGFRKVLTKEPSLENDYTASFMITVNEAKMKLTDNTLSIHDQMTETLYYLPGTMEITAETRDGTQRTLTLDTDYTLESDATQHKLIITILNPAEEMYTLTYDTAIIVPEGSTRISYSNSATVNLFGETFEASSDKKFVTDVTISAKNFSVKVLKQDEISLSPLEGSVFGLFAENGEKITEGTTDKNGEISFVTNVSNGIILREHIPFYIMEIKAPSGYITDETKHWIFFCAEDDSCNADDQLYSKYEGIVRFTSDKSERLTITNRHGYYLPETGRHGCLIYISGGTGIMILTLLWAYRIRRKRERRQN